MTDDDLARIARGLTKAQKRALLMLDGNLTTPKCLTVSSNAYKSLNDAWGGVLVGSDWRLNTSRAGPTHRKAYRLTPLGLRVRTYLENHDDR